MESYHDQVLDSPSKNSYIGSYYQPPDRIRPTSIELELPARFSISLDPKMSSPCAAQAKHNIDSRAVVDALKTLQEKIGRLELERKQVERSFRHFSQDATKQQQQQQQQHQQQTTTTTTESYNRQSQLETSLPETDNSKRKELDSKLQSAESRCKVLEKQLDYMRKMADSVKNERNALMENQTVLQKQQRSSSDHQTQKLEKLEAECHKLSRTQTLAEMKLALLEQKLLKEEHERKLLQERAGEFQKELDRSLRSSSPVSEEIKPKKKTPKKPLNELVSPIGPMHKKFPFVAGKSTSPSHSVHANVQSILHMMKHHQPQLCERVSAVHRLGRGAKKSLQKDFSPPSTTVCKADGEREHADQSLSSLFDLLLALQDELGQMSFEHQELVRQLDATQHQEQRMDLQRELERLEARMEEKGAQITKLRKHQQTVHKLTQHQPCPNAAKKFGGIPPPIPKQRGKNGGVTQRNLQILRETQKFRNSLKKDDLLWET